MVMPEGGQKRTAPATGLTVAQSLKEVGKVLARGSLDTEPEEGAAGRTVVSDGSLSLGGAPKFQDGMKELPLGPGFLSPEPLT